jgi:hypothetical protein
MQTRRSAVVACAVAMLAAAASLSACTPDGGTDAAPTSAGATPSASAPPAPAAPAVLNPEGSAADNKAFFDQVNQATIAANPAAGGVDFTSNLRTSGFDIAAMQVTADVTTVGVAADSIQFSVHWKDECLIGQYGRAVYTSTVAPVLGSGGCLIGQTRPIDW